MTKNNMVKIMTRGLRATYIYNIASHFVRPRRECLSQRVEGSTIRNMLVYLRTSSILIFKWECQKYAVL